jgi:DNA-binding transcriptional ArsR family regulator
VIPLRGRNAAAIRCLLVGLAILLALAEHDSGLTTDQLAAQLSENPLAVDAVLRELRGQGLVEVPAAGEVEGHSREAPSYWLLSDEGRGHVDRRRLN